MNEVAINPLRGKVVRFRSRSDVPARPRLEILLLRQCSEQLFDLRQRAMQGPCTVSDSDHEACRVAFRHFTRSILLVLDDPRSTAEELQIAREHMDRERRDNKWAEACTRSRELQDISEATALNLKALAGAR